MRKADLISTEAPMGRREANKHEKLARIRSAARDVFLAKGFEEANLREIATAAHVGFGTLFLYAKNKQDLLLLLFDEELPLIAQSAFRKACQEDRFIDQLVAYFAEFYDYYIMTPQLSRDMLREVTFKQGIVAKRMLATMKSIEKNLARLVAKAQADGIINSALTPDLVAHLIFSLHRVEIRFCLDTKEPSAATSLAALRAQFQILFDGLSTRGDSKVETLTQPMPKSGRR